MSMSIIIKGHENAAPLYRKYDGQDAPQQAYLQFDPEEETDLILTADYNTEIGNTLPSAVVHRRVLRFNISPLSSHDSLLALANDEKLAALLAAVRDAYSEGRSDNNYISTYDGLSEDFEEEIERHLADVLVDAEESAAGIKITFTNDSDTPVLHTYPGNAKPQYAFLEFDMSLPGLSLLAKYDPSISAALPGVWVGSVIHFGIPATSSRSSILSLADCEILVANLRQLRTHYEQQANAIDWLDRKALPDDCRSLLWSTVNLIQMQIDRHEWLKESPLEVVITGDGCNKDKPVWCKYDDHLTAQPAYLTFDMRQHGLKLRAEFNPDPYIHGTLGPVFGSDVVLHFSIPSDTTRESLLALEGNADIASKLRYLRTDFDERKQAGWRFASMTMPQHIRAVVNEVSGLILRELASSNPTEAAEETEEDFDLSTDTSDTSRSAWAVEALKQFVSDTRRGCTLSDLSEGEQEEAISDLICDLLHYANGLGLDGNDVVLAATVNFNAEVAQQQEEDAQ